jgi:protein arginine N-methyltransferase 1
VLDFSPMYHLHDYARMLADAQRTEAFVRALEVRVVPGSVVVDMGTGTGLFALVACRLGARRVYAIDTNPVIEVARELARENGCSDRIEFIQGDVREVELPERAGVVVSDMRGGLPMAGAHLSAIDHARKEFLAPSGELIPRSDTLHAAIVGSAPLYGWATGPAEVGGTTMRAMRDRLCNTVHRDRSRSIAKEHLLTPAVQWAALDYARLEPGPVHGKITWSSEQDADGHGAVLWFDTVLTEGIGFSTAPGTQGVYPQTFLPWPAPTPLRKGDIIELEVWAQGGGEAWGWNTRITGRDSRVEYKQSTFFADIARPAALPIRRSTEAS